MSCILLDEGLPPHADPMERTAWRDIAPLVLGRRSRSLGPPAPRSAAAPGRLLPLASAAPVFVCGSCSSTFDVAWRLLDGLPPWGAVLAVSQRQGRGQLRRRWHSPPGNLHVSWRLPDVPIFSHAAAAVAAGYMAQQALERLAVATELKWPNDLLAPDGDWGAKVGGILLEERDHIVLAGLGLNLLLAPPDALLRDARALPAVALGTGQAPLPFWIALCEAMRAVAAPWTHCAPHEVIAGAATALAWKGRPVLAEGASRPSWIIGLDEQGALLLRDAAGERRAMTTGDLRPWPDAV